MKPLFCLLFLAFLFTMACKPAAKEPAKDDNGEMVLKDTMSYDEAKKLVKNFGKRVYKKHQGGLILSDTRCVWFSIKQLDTLVQQIKREDGDGIRFYMATYDSTEDKSYKVPPKYRNCSTLIMVSTKDSVVNDTLHVHADYFGNTIKNKRGAIFGATPENQGELCPPPSNCTAEGAKLLPQ